MMSAYVQTKSSPAEDGTKSSLFHAKTRNMSFFTFDYRSSQFCEPILSQFAIWNLFKEVTPISVIRRGPAIPLLPCYW